MTDVVVWYRSRAVLAAIATIIMAALSAFHVLPGLTKDQLVQFLAIAIPAAVALEGRISATKRIAATPSRAAAALSSNPSAVVPIDPSPEVPAPPQEQPMSIKTFLVEVEESAVADLKAAGTILESLFISETQKFVAEIKDTDIGARAMNLIAAFENTSMSGAERMTTLLSLIGSDLAALAANGGLKGLVTSVENFAKEFCDSAYNDFKAAAEKALGAKGTAATAPSAA